MTTNLFPPERNERSDVDLLAMTIETIISKERKMASATRAFHPKPGWMAAMTESCLSLRGGFAGDFRQPDEAVFTMLYS
jgi:hypothetical protein